MPPYQGQNAWCKHAPGHLGLYDGGDHLCDDDDDDDDHGLEEVLSAFEAVTPLQWTEVLPLPQLHLNMYNNVKSTV